ncbi:toprim domain-containing protein [Flavobacterium turcicum]|uniref:Toprim domain-containing protein n=1 Tax=Flavobacterium turcicum TaxID=2764718 RepID=A0ABR7JEA0_9FLAO|nr:toprim domain-containing protein [Flavobacterium turcicum]MBC5862832.1 toprim domain-containing protein [Flavobacterium turcicum]NHL01564.1 DNA primase [Flavobacterium turcicum]
MDFRKQRLLIEDVKKIDITAYLSSLGFQPVKIRNADYWYNSPLRKENDPSFKVNQKLNVWFDHGLGKGGNLIDFGLLFHDCNLIEFLEKINTNLYTQNRIIEHVRLIDSKEGKLKIVDDFPLRSTSLLNYLEDRKIPLEIARQFCREVRYEINDKKYFGIGFKNNSGGYEIRNPYYKISSSPKDITSIINGATEVAVFEGFIDFLSFKATTKNLPENGQDFVVLNSVSFFERARPFMENHESIRLYLDRDNTGLNCTERALSLSTKYKDESHLYKSFNDFNDYLTQSSKASKKHFRRKL